MTLSRYGGSVQTEHICGAADTADLAIIQQNLGKECGDSAGR
jgi:hypothetical protein